MNEQELNQKRETILNDRMLQYWENMCKYSHDYYDIWKSLRTKVDNALNTNKNAKQIVSILKKYKTPKKYLDRKDEFESHRNTLIDKFEQFKTGKFKQIISL